MTGFSPWLAANLHVITVWFGAICTLGLYSVLYRENRIYRFFEHLFLGLATGFLVANTWTDIVLPKWWAPMWDKGQWWYVFAVLVGAYYYFIYSRRHNWIARLIIGFFLGVASGQAFQAYANDYWPQIPSSFKPIIPHAASPVVGAALTWGKAIDNLFFMFIIVCVMSYFFFSFEHRWSVVRNSSQLGRWLMMFTFGAIFGATMMARFALLIDRIDYLITDFGPTVAGPIAGRYVALAILLAFVAVLILFGIRGSSGGEGEGSAS